MYIVNPLVTRGVTRGLNPKKVLQGGQNGTGGVVPITNYQLPIKAHTSTCNPYIIKGGYICPQGAPYTPKWSLYALSTTVTYFRYPDNFIPVFNSL